MDMKEWNLMIAKAKHNLNASDVSNFLSCGTYSCVVLTEKGNVYSGININSNLQNISAEKAALSNMVSNGETKVKKILVMNELEETILPIDDLFMCLIELNIDLNKVLIFSKDQEYKMNDLVPDWWGTFRISR